MKLSAALIAVLAVACTLPIRPGVSTEADVIEYFGKPVETRVIAEGHREFDYPRGPLGRETWRVTLDQAGKVITVEQLLDPTKFGRIKSGMTREQVRAALGRHDLTMSFANLNEEVWSWRYRELGGLPYFLNAHFNVSTGLLTYTSRTPDYVPPEISVRALR